MEIIKSCEKPQLAQHPLKNDDRAEACGLFLSNVFTLNKDLGIDSTDLEVNFVLKSKLQPSPTLRCCTPAEVRRTIMQLELRKAPGFDPITAEILRKLTRNVIVYIPHSLMPN